MGNVKISVTLVLSVSRRLLQPVGDAAEQSGLPHRQWSHQALFSERRGTTGKETSQQGYWLIIPRGSDHDYGSLHIFSAYLVSEICCLLC